MKCFYHASDMDGWCSAAIIAKYTKNYNKEDYIGIDYNRNKITNYDITDIRNEDVYISDISFTEENKHILLRLVNQGNRVHWNDHHESSLIINKLYTEIRAIPGIRDKAHSGAYNTYLYLYGTNATVPAVIDYVSDWDCFTFKYGDTTKYFKYGIDLDVWYTYPLSTQWSMLLNNFRDSGYLSRIISNGEIIYKYITNEYRGYCKANIFESTIDNYKCAVINRSSNSLIFGDLYNEYPIVSAFVFDGEKYKYSLYSSNKDIDCSAIAKKYGGGGHKGAAGFTSDKIIFPFIKRIDIK